MPGGFSYLGNFRVNEESGEVMSQAIGSSALLATAADASTIEVSSDTGKLQLKVQGASLTGGVQRTRMSKYTGTWIRGALAVSASTAGVFQLQNTYGSDLIVTRIIIHITTVSSVDGTVLDIGLGSGASTSYNNLIDGLSATATGAFDNLENNGSSGKHIGLWQSGSGNQYINASALASDGSAASPTNLVGFYAVHVLDISN